MSRATPPRIAGHAPIVTVIIKEQIDVRMIEVRDNLERGSTTSKLLFKTAVSLD